QLPIGETFGYLVSPVHSEGGLSDTRCPADHPDQGGCAGRSSLRCEEQVMQLPKLSAPAGKAGRVPGELLGRRFGCVAVRHVAGRGCTVRRGWAVMAVNRSAGPGGFGFTGQDLLMNPLQPGVRLDPQLVY